MAVAAAYVVLWVAAIVARATPGDPVVLLALVAATSAATGWSVARPAAVVLPVAVVPAFAVPSAYTPGAEPDYGVGAFAATVFLAVAVPAVAAGVAVRRRRTA
jgi:hypothetical protein